MPASLRPRIPLARPWLTFAAEYHRAVADILERRFVSNFSKYCQLLESVAVKAVDNPRTLAVSSCDVGLVLAWRALGCRSGEVIVPSFTFCSTVNALRWNGLIPVFADIKAETLCIDPESVRALISPRTVGIAATHTFGRPAPVRELDQLARERGLTLVFDAAHAIGTRYEGLGMGAYGDATVFSLSGTKLVTSGEGGLVSFRAQESADRFRALRGYGFLDDYNCRDVGLNGKISEMNAALGWLSLQRSDEALRRRREIAALYRKRLDGIATVSFQQSEPNTVHSYNYFSISLQTEMQRRMVEDALRSAGVETKRYFLPVHKMDAYLQTQAQDLAVTLDVYDRLLCLPIFHELREEELDEICDLIVRVARD